MSKWLTNYMFTGGYPLKPRISKRLMWAIIYLQPSRNPPVIAVVLNGIFLLVYGDLDIFMGHGNVVSFWGDTANLCMNHFAGTLLLCVLQI